MGSLGSMGSVSSIGSLGSMSSIGLYEVLWGSVEGSKAIPYHDLYEGQKFKYIGVLHICLACLMNLYLNFYSVTLHDKFICLYVDINIRTDIIQDVYFKKY
jgi:hypothetical protein